MQTRSNSHDIPFIFYKEMEICKDGKMNKEKSIFRVHVSCIDNNIGDCSSHNTAVWYPNGDDDVYILRDLSTC